MADTVDSGSTGAIYICTEDTFPSKRLRQLIAQQPRLRTDVPAEVIRNIRFGDQIFVEHAADVVSHPQPQEHTHGRQGW